MYRTYSHIFVLLCLARTPWLDELPAAVSARAEDLYSLASSCYQDQDWSGAVEHLESFIRLHPQDRRAADAMFFLGEALVEVNHSEQASQWYRRYLAEPPRIKRHRVRAEFRVAEIAHLSNQTKEARAAFERFASHHVHDQLAGHALYYLGEMALAAGQFERAQRWYAASVDRFPDGPMAGAAMYGRARSWQMSGNREQASQIYRQLINLDTKRYASGARYQLGLLEYELRHYSRAADLLADLLEQDPQNANAAPAQYWLGMCRLYLSQFESAAESFYSATVSSDDKAVVLAARFYRAEALQSSGQTKAATRIYREIADRVANDLWSNQSRLALMELADQRKDYQGVTELFAQLTTADMPKQVQRQARELAQRASAALGSQPLQEQAGPDIARVQIESTPTESQLLERAKQLLPAESPIPTSGRSGDQSASFAECRERLLKVVRSPREGLQPTAVEAQWWIAESYYRQGDYERALREFLRLEVLYPIPHWQAQAVRRAGACYQQLGDDSGSRQMTLRLAQRYSEVNADRPLSNQQLSNRQSGDRSRIEIPSTTNKLPIVQRVAMAQAR